MVVALLLGHAIGTAMAAGKRSEREEVSAGGASCMTHGIMVPAGRRVAVWLLQRSHVESESLRVAGSCCGGARASSVCRVPA